jgi:hypothetical protein
MRQLARRLQRLESTSTFIDIHLSVNRLVHDAALEVDLPAACHQQLQADVDARLHALRQIVPASSRMNARLMRWCARAARRCVPSWIPSWTNLSALASTPP